MSTPTNCSLGNIDVVGNTLAHCDLTTTVSTNNPTGYTLSLNTVEELSTSNDNTCLRHNTASTTACTATPSNKKFTPDGSNIPVASFAVYTWGASVDNSGSPTYNTYNSIPNFTTTGLTLRSSTANTLNEATTTRFGVKGDISLTVGGYSQNVLLTTTLNDRPLPNITNVSPLTGGAGTLITLTGTNFIHGGNPLLYQIKLGGDTTCNNLTIISTTEATCSIPELSVSSASITGYSVYGDFVNPFIMFNYVQIATWVISNTTLAGASASSIQIDKDSALLPVVYKDTSNNYPNVWANYDSKQWANAIIVKADKYATYSTAPAGTPVPMEDILAFYVYLPRYAYQVQRFAVSDPSIATPTLFNITFQKNTDTKYIPSATGDLATHPAFTFGAEELNGIWFGKFQSGTAEYSDTELTKGSTKANTLIKPGVYSLANMDVSSQFTTSQNLKSQYNLNADTDARMTKNSDFGAALYLTTSNYGIGTQKLSLGLCIADNGIGMDDGSQLRVLTGYGSSTDDGSHITDETDMFNSCTNPDDMYDGIYGITGSTTGTVYGIYDFNNGLIEYTMANLNNSTGYNTSSNAGFNGPLAAGGSISDGAPFPIAKYLDVYPAPPFSTYDPYGNFDLCTWAACGGHALYETVITSPVTSDDSSWGGSGSVFAYVMSPWFLRGGFPFGALDDPGHSGQFAVSPSPGFAVPLFGFRSVLSF
jgi:hypothetical protein